MRSAAIFFAGLIAGMMLLGVGVAWLAPGPECVPGSFPATSA